MCCVRALGVCVCVCLSLSLCVCVCTRVCVRERERERERLRERQRDKRDNRAYSFALDGNEHSAQGRVSNVPPQHSVVAIENRALTDPTAPRPQLRRVCSEQRAVQGKLGLVSITSPSPSPPLPTPPLPSSRSAVSCSLHNANAMWSGRLRSSAHCSIGVRARCDASFEGR